ncbi:MAG: hypothetical protein R2861_02110 [Desulfobacterales bacterium]
MAARIISAVAGLDWPQDKLEIQMLDDSDDNTKTIPKQYAYWKAMGKKYPGDSPKPAHRLQSRCTVQ